MCLKRIEGALEVISGKADGVLITKRENIYYLTGFMPTVVAFLFLSDEPVLFVNEMDAESAEGCGIHVEVFKRVSDVSDRVELRSIAVEPSMPVGLIERIGLGRDFQVMDPIAELRMVKDREEIRRIDAALKIAEESFKKLEFRGSESEIAARLDYIMRLEGSEGVSFDTIVTSASRSSIPHAVPTSNGLGSPALVDWGAVYGGYHSDTTRTFVESEREHEILEVVIEAKREGLRAAKPGVRACEVDSAVRNVIEEYGYADNFIHSSGHGVGLEVHEKPSLSADDKTVLAKGMVLTIEPGVYLTGEFGVRVEDMLVVGDGVMNRLPDHLR
ncbi:Xaa-Pro peptidase family protein [Methanothermobacter sp. K4]|uniref:M24 family metallopeptidase n=1 Tax=Methanothermobacter sp. K4 TaxID=2913262 RepID=UPI001EDBC38D|nr:M24 family metallopeptidase [Methanothermobacter sp. K4]MCG2828348.1 aminopeptidase P family protein [Methanothermobacter sp. K4]